jgi:hypothetical protein
MCQVCDRWHTGVQKTQYLATANGRNQWSDYELAPAEPCDSEVEQQKYEAVYLRTVLRCARKVRRAYQVYD